jgi:uncharacterized protein YqjF (DUF2071 family)
MKFSHDRFIPVHPVPMRTAFRHCFLVNFALRPDVLASKLPEHLRPDVHDGWSYLSIVIAEMERMRPAFLPRVLGVTYSQVVYRAVVVCGRERGVYFLRSDADSALMVLAGNALTFFRFHRADATWSFAPGITRFSLRPRVGDAAAIDAEYDLADAKNQMPATSRFATLDRAQSFLTELYVAFGTKRRDGMVDAVRIQRNDWRSMIVRDRVGSYEAIKSGVLFGPDQAELDSIFYVERLDYHWHRGIVVDGGNGSQPTTGLA